MLANMNASPTSASRLGTKLENPRRRGRVPIQCCGVACAQVAKKPNHKPNYVNSPADTFRFCHSTEPRSSAAAATSIGLTAHVSITVFLNKPALFWTNSATSGAAICALMSTRPKQASPSCRRRANTNACPWDRVRRTCSVRSAAGFVGGPTLGRGRSTE